jgi:hypothetical protein
MVESDYQTWTDQKTVTQMLRDAKRALGTEYLQSLLPEPFKLWVSDHDTGCQVTIDARTEGKPVLTAYRGSIWYSSCYEFNDDKKLLGVAPAFGFARDVLNDFFTNASDALATKTASAAMNSAADKASADRSRDDALAHYRSVLFPKPRSCKLAGPNSN